MTINGKQGKYLTSIVIGGKEQRKQSSPQQTAEGRVGNEGKQDAGQSKNNHFQYQLLLVYGVSRDTTHQIGNSAVLLKPFTQRKM